MWKGGDGGRKGEGCGKGGMVGGRERDVERGDGGREGEGCGKGGDGGREGRAKRGEEIISIFSNYDRE